MSDIIEPPEPDLDDRDLDGHRMDELVDYLDRGRTPVDPSIEGSPGCQIALASLARLREISAALMEAEAAAEEPRDEAWVTDILSYIGMEARASRDIPLRWEPGVQDAGLAPGVHLSVSEGAVRGLIRAAGDDAGGVLIGRCRLEGDVSVPGDPITVDVEASVAWGEPIAPAAERIRASVAAALRRHSHLNVVAIDVAVHDVQTTDQEDSP